MISNMGPVQKVFARFAVLVAVILVVYCCKPDPAVDGAGQSTGTPNEDEFLSPCDGAGPAYTVDFAATDVPVAVRVYVDASGSMRGFAATGGALGSLSRALRGVLSVGLRMQRAEVVLVGRELEPLTEGLSSFEVLDDPGFYTRPETNLAAVFDAEIEAASQGDSLAVLITDGVTSLQDGGRTTQLSDCQSGADMICLALRVEQLVGQGCGFWIVGLRSRFSGTLYSEVARLGGSPVGSVATEGRPLYLWVVARHVPAARSFITELLAASGLGGDPSRFFVLEVAPGAMPWKVWEPSSPMSFNRVLYPGLDLGAVARGVPSAESGRPVVEAAVSGLQGRVFEMQLPVHAPAAAGLPSTFATLETYRHSLCVSWGPHPPDMPVQVRVVDPDRNMKLAVMSATLTGLAGLELSIVQTLVLEKRAKPPLDLAQWSTTDDTTAASADRTLNLERFLDALDQRVTPPPRLAQPVLSVRFQ